MTTRTHIGVALSLLTLLLVIHVAIAEPLSAPIAERLQELSNLSLSIEQSRPLSGDEWVLIEKSLQSADDVTLAVATLFLQQIQNERSRALLTKIGALDTQRGMLTDAVFKLGQVKFDVANVAPDEVAARWQKMATDSNPYSRIAAAKVLCSIDPKAAKAILLRLENEKSEISPVANRIRRHLAERMGEDQPPPIPGFEGPYTWFERGAGSLAMVQFKDAKINRNAAQQESSPPASPSPSPPIPKKSPDAKPTPWTPSEEPTSSTPWSVIVILIVAASGLLWLLLKRRS